MEMIHCPNCRQYTGFKRSLGFGTFFMVLITFGLWLFAIVLYPVRCMRCGLTRRTAWWENFRRDSPEAYAMTMKILTGAALLFLAAMIFSVIVALLES